MATLAPSRVVNIAILLPVLLTTLAPSIYAHYQGLFMAKMCLQRLRSGPRWGANDTSPADPLPGGQGSPPCTRTTFPLFTFGLNFRHFLYRLLRHNSINSTCCKFLAQNAVQQTVYNKCTTDESDGVCAWNWKSPWHCRAYLEPWQSANVAVEATKNGKLATFDLDVVLHTVQYTHSDNNYRRRRRFRIGR